MPLANAFLPVPPAELDDLRDRLRRARWPEPWPGTDGWHAGVPQEVLRRLAGTWASTYDWRAAEARIAALPWHEAVVSDVPLRYLRFDGQGPSPVPIVVTNGWPSTFLELVPLARELARQVDGGSCTVIVPVLPGFPGAPQQTGLPPAVQTHELWHGLMHDELGFDRYVAHGGDLGAGTSARLAQAHPEAVAGLHLLAVADPREVDPSSITPEERAALDEDAAWSAQDGAYEHQQRTRPVTLSYGLSDSPVGLLAWILEKYHDWTDHRPGDVSALDEELILTQASLYWFTNSIGTSFRPYFEHAEGHTDAIGRVVVPTAVALFPKDLAHPPRSWVARTYAVQEYTRFPEGGHFAPAEVPEVLAGHVRAFARSVWHSA